MGLRQGEGGGGAEGNDGGLREAGGEFGEESSAADIDGEGGRVSEEGCVCAHGDGGADCKGE